MAEEYSDPIPEVRIPEARELSLMRVQQAPWVVAQGPYITHDPLFTTVPTAAY